MVSGSSTAAALNFGNNPAEERLVSSNWMVGSDGNTLEKDHDKMVVGTLTGCLASFFRIYLEHI